LNRFGNPKFAACAGMVIFTQFWYWFPLINFFPLTLSPCSLIGVDRNLRVPKGFQFKSGAKPSLFDYPPHIKPDDKKKDVKKKAVELSLTSKYKTRAAKRARGKDEMEIEPSKTGKMEEEGVEKGEMEEEKQEEKPAEKVEEPNFKIYDNFSRVLPKQEEYITFLQDSRYRPVLQVKITRNN